MTKSKKSPNDDISLLFKEAKDKLDEIDKEANDKKSDIVIQLAIALEGKIPLQSISSTILKKLKGKVGKSLIHQFLPAKYKQEYRINNAHKQKQKLKVSNLAPLSALNPQLYKEAEIEDKKQKNKVLVMAGTDGSSHIQSDEIEESIENEIEDRAEYASNDNTFTQSLSNSQQEPEQQTKQNTPIKEDANNIVNGLKDASYNSLVYNMDDDSKKPLEQHQHQLIPNTYKIAKVPNANSMQISDNDGDILHFNFFKTFNVLQVRLNELLSKVGYHGQVCFKGGIDRKSGKVLYCDIEEPNQQNLTEKSIKNDIATAYKSGEREN